MKSYSVYQITKLLRSVVEHNPNFKDITVEGEITELKQYSKYFFFNLQEIIDNRAYILPVVFWESKSNYYSAHTKNKLKELLPLLLNRKSGGIKVLAQGDLTIYPPRGTYTLILRRLIITNELGLRKQQFIVLFNKLKQKGFFEKRYKKKIPEYPENIAVITSLTSAARNDIEKTIKLRNKNINVYFVNSPMQGKDVEQGVISALNFIEKRLNFVDFIIIARGGGSQEDLWYFNSEKLAIRIFKANIPIVTGIGHEIDKTIIDFVADLSTSTPTQAVERTIKSQKQLLTELNNFKSNLSHLLIQIISKNKELLKRFHIIINKSVNIVFNSHKQRNKNYKEILSLSLSRKLEEYKVHQHLHKILQSYMSSYLQKLKNYNGRLHDTLKSYITHKVKYEFGVLEYWRHKINDNIQKKLNQNSYELQIYKSELKQLMEKYIKNQKYTLEILKKELMHSFPSNVLEQGYTLVEQNGKIIKYKNDFDITKPFTIIWQDGSITLQQCKEK